MNFFVLLSCILVAGVGYAHGDFRGMEFWNSIASEYGLPVKAELNKKETKRAQNYFYSYCSSGKTVGGFAPISYAAPKVLSIYIKNVLEGDYLEVFSSFQGITIDKRFAAFANSGEIISLEADVYEDKLKEGVKDFIKARKREFQQLSAPMTRVGINYHVIKIGHIDKPELYIYTQIYGV